MKLTNNTHKLSTKNSIFNYYPPKGEYIGLISIPHSGVVIPDEFKQYLHTNNDFLMQDVDFGVHELVNIEQLQMAGIGVLKSNISRVAIDLNRPEEKCLLNWKKNSHGVEIVIGEEPSAQTQAKLVGSFYLPYFEMLKALVNELKSKMNTASFVDLHSMPSKATAYHLAITPKQNPNRPDFCISDQKGRTCHPNYIQSISEDLSKSFGKVTNNDPYFGGHITVEMDRLFPDDNNIQIEINRKLYMDESKFCFHSDEQDYMIKNLTPALIRLFQQFYTLNKN
jgi:N-formylglutamate amidohydrolase